MKQVLRPEGELTIKAEHDELSRISIERSVSIEEVRKEIVISSDTFVADEDWR